MKDQHEGGRGDSARSGEAKIDAFLPITAGEASSPEETYFAKDTQVHFSSCLTIRRKACVAPGAAAHFCHLQGQKQMRSARETDAAGNSKVTARLGVPWAKYIMHTFSHFMPKSDSHLFLTLI